MNFIRKSLPPNWTCIKIGEVIKFEYGKSLTKKRRQNCGVVPVYGSNGIVGYHNESLVKQPCLIIGRKGAAGKVQISQKPCWPIDTTYFVVPPDTINLPFLYYLLSEMQLSKLDRSTAIPGLNRNDAYSLEIPLPPLPEQERIVARIEELFTQLDAGTAALKRVQAGLKRYKASVLKAAVEGKLVPQDPDDEPAEAILHQLGKRPLESEDLPELPNGWCWVDLKNLAADEPFSITDGPFGSNLKTAHYTKSGPRVIRLQNIGDGEFRDEKAHISQEHFLSLKKYSIFAGDLVIAGLGELLPRACVIPEYVGNAIVKADCIRFKPNNRLAKPKFLLAALNSDPIRIMTKNIIHGIGRPRLNQQEIKSIPVPLPPILEQERIVEELDCMLSILQNIEATTNESIARSTHLRQGILQQAFEGKLA